MSSFFYVLIYTLLSIHISHSFKLSPAQTVGKSLSSMQSNIAQDILATTVCTGLATGLIAVLTKLAKDKVIDTKLCRKLIHTLSAPAYMFAWPLYSSSEFETRVIASLLPLLQLVRLINAGTSEKIDNYKSQSKTNGYNLADAVSRSGSRREAIGGPLIYCTVLFTSVLFVFR